MARRRSGLLLAATGWLALAATDARATCDVIPQPEILFPGATASLSRVFAADGDVLVLSRDEAGCDAATPSFATVAPSDNVVTFLFTPPDGPPTAVVQASAAYCTDFAASGFEAACEASVGAGNALCVPYGSPPTASADRLVVPFVAQGRAGPVKLAVSAAGAAPPCQIATQACAAQAGLAACIDELFEPDTCSTAPQHRHRSFPGLTAMSAPNVYADLCTSSNPSVRGRHRRLGRRRGGRPRRLLRRQPRQGAREEEDRLRPRHGARAARAAPRPGDSAGSSSADPGALA